MDGPRTQGGGIAVAEIVNLRHARKARARAERESEAAANRARHGRSKSERERERLEQQKAKSVLDQAKRSDDERG